MTILAIFEESGPTSLSLLFHMLETPQFLCPKSIADWLPDFPLLCVFHTVPLEIRMIVKRLHSVTRTLNPNNVPKLMENLPNNKAVV